jgi:hypothetical protein
LPGVPAGRYVAGHAQGAPDVFENSVHFAAAIGRSRATEFDELCIPAWLMVLDLTSSPADVLARGLQSPALVNFAPLVDLLTAVAGCTAASQIRRDAINEVHSLWLYFQRSLDQVLEYEYVIDHGPGTDWRNVILHTCALNDCLDLEYDELAESWRQLHVCADAVSCATIVSDAVALEITSESLESGRLELASEQAAFDAELAAAESRLNRLQYTLDSVNVAYSTALDQSFEEIQALQAAVTEQALDNYSTARELLNVPNKGLVLARIGVDAETLKEMMERALDCSSGTIAESY